MVSEGRKAPAFTLQDDKGQKVSLKDYAGKTVVLYFYPRDNTSGCTREACDFRDAKTKLKRMGVEVIGVSKDSVASHEKFKAKHKLNFTLLSDPDTKMQQKYGVWREKKLYGKTSMGTVRSTFIIGPDGKVKRIFDKVRVNGHVDAVVEAVKDLKE